MRAERIATVRPVYLEALTMVERLHRRLLDVIKDEFDRRGRSDVNAVQALLLYNIGDKELTAGELRTRGYYLGSNVSYNVKKLVEMGYLHHARSRIDRRSVRISLTEKGRDIHNIVVGLYEKHAMTVEQIGGVMSDDFAAHESVAGPARALLDRSDQISSLSLAASRRATREKGTPRGVPFAFARHRGNAGQASCRRRRGHKFARWIGFLTLIEV